MRARALLLALAMATVGASGVGVVRAIPRWRGPCPDSFVADPGALPFSWRAAPGSPLGDVAPFAVEIRTGPNKPLPELESAELSTPDTCGQRTFALQFPQGHVRADALAGTLRVRYLPPLYVITTAVGEEDVPLLVLRREPDDTRRASSSEAQLRVRLALALLVAATAACIQAFRARKERWSRFAVGVGPSVVCALVAPAVVRGEDRRTEPRSTPGAEVTLHREPMTTGGWTRMSLKTKLVFDEKTDARSHGGELLVRHRWRTRAVVVESHVESPMEIDVRYLSERISNGESWLALDEPTSLAGREFRLLHEAGSGAYAILPILDPARDLLRNDFPEDAQIVSPPIVARVGDGIHLYDDLLRGLVRGQLDATVFGHPMPEQAWDVRVAAARETRAELAVELKTPKPATFWGSSLSLKGELTVTIPGGRPVALRVKGDAYNGFGTMAGPLTHEGSFELSVEWSYR